MKTEAANFSKTLDLRASASIPSGALTSSTERGFASLKASPAPACPSTWITGFSILAYVVATLLLLALAASAQESFHDPTLDSINSGIGNMDASMNGYFQQYGKWLGAGDIKDYQNQNSNSIPGLTNAAIGGAMTNSGALTGGVSNIMNGITFSNMASVTARAGTNNSGSVSNRIGLGTFNGQSYAMDMSLLTGGYINSSVCQLVRNIVMAIVWWMMFRYSLDYMQQALKDSMNQKQVQGSNQSIMGFSATAVIALGYAAVITAALAAVLGKIATNGFIKTSATSALQVGSLIDTAANLPSWDVMTAMVPLPDMVGAVISYCTFRYLLAWPLFSAVSAIILLLIA